MIWWGEGGASAFFCTPSLRRPHAWGFLTSAEIWNTRAAFAFASSRKAAASRTRVLELSRKFFPRLPQTLEANASKLHLEKRTNKLIPGCMILYLQQEKKRTVCSMFFFIAQFCSRSTLQSSDLHTSLYMRLHLQKQPKNRGT